MSKYMISTDDGHNEIIEAKGVIDSVNKFYKDPNMADKTIKLVELMAEVKNETPTLILKFGAIKGGDYSNSPEASKLSDQLNSIFDDSDRKKKECEIIDLFKGDILIWWGQIKATKEQAKDYIINYESVNSRDLT